MLPTMQKFLVKPLSFPPPSSLLLSGTRTWYARNKGADILYLFTSKPYDVADATAATKIDQASSFSSFSRHDVRVRPSVRSFRARWKEKLHFPSVCFCSPGAFFFQQQAGGVENFNFGRGADERTKCARGMSEVSGGRAGRSDGSRVAIKGRRQDNFGLTA